MDIPSKRGSHVKQLSDVDKYETFEFIKKNRGIYNFPINPSNNYNLIIISDADLEEINVAMKHHYKAKLKARERTRQAREETNVKVQKRNALIHDHFAEGKIVLNELSPSETLALIEILTKPTKSAILEKLGIEQDSDSDNSSK
jgi:hypothetical protein